MFSQSERKVVRPICVCRAYFGPVSHVEDNAAYGPEITVVSKTLQQGITSDQTSHHTSNLPTSSPHTFSNMMDLCDNARQTQTTLGTANCRASKPHTPTLEVRDGRRL